MEYETILIILTSYPKSIKKVVELLNSLGYTPQAKESELKKRSY